MTDEEWNKLHGYDADGEPTQRYAWESIGPGPPCKKSILGTSDYHIWLVDTVPETGNHSIRLVVHNQWGHWEAAGFNGHHPAEGRFHSVLQDGTPHDDAIKQLTARWLLRGGDV